jgi:hypothetical protein
MVSERVRRVLRPIGLLLSGVVVVALTGAIVAIASLQGPPVTEVRPIDAVSVGAGSTTWVCAPAPVVFTEAAGVDVDYDPDLGTGGDAVSTVVELAAIGDGEAPVMTVGGIGEDGEEADSAGGALTLETRTDVADPQAAVVEPTAAGVPLVGGLTVARADSGDLRALSATTCQQPVTSAMLVGGSTELGSSARLVLSNPGATAATVTLTGWGSTGPLPEIGQVVVPAESVRAVLLEAISLEPRIAIRIDVEGGRVVPTLQDSSLDGLIASGTETIGAAADPATTLTIGAVRLVDDDAARASLRLVNPADEAATVTVELLGPDGPFALEGAVDSVIEAGTVVDISLAGPPNGRYGIRVTSDVPVTGAVTMSRTGTPGEDDPDTAPVDIAWLPASAPVDRGVLPIPTAMVDAVGASVTNPGDAAVDVSTTSYDASGEVLEEGVLPVAAGATVTLPVPEGTVAVVVAGEGILASVVATADAADGTLIAAYPVVGDPYVEQSVQVRVSN